MMLDYQVLGRTDTGLEIAYIDFRPGIYHPITHKLQYSITHTPECSSLRHALRHCNRLTLDGQQWLRNNPLP